MKLSDIKNEIRAFIIANLSGITEDDFAFEDESWSLEPGEIKIRESFIGSDDIDVTDEAFMRVISIEYAMFQTNDGTNLVDDLIFDFEEIFKFGGGTLSIDDEVEVYPIKTTISSIRDANYRGRSLLVFFRMLKQNQK